MGNSKDDHNTTIHHFNHHHHPLIQTNLLAMRDVSCNGCKLDLLSDKAYFRCQSCSFHLHRICYEMSRKMQHPSHPNHALTLVVTPLSAQDGALNCQACGHQIAGFYYNCAECAVHYHVLCSMMPQTLSISSHQHALNLEFSPPYAFECDLCMKPCYNGWLYRCKSCEFDSHLNCAISRIGDDQDNHELMQLVSQAANKKDKISPEISQTGLNEKANSPDQQERSRKTRPDSTEPSPNRNGQTRDTDRFSPFSGELSATPSYQFSDACFSIDLTKSYTSNNSINSRFLESSQEGKDQTKRYTINNVMLDKIASNLEASKQELFHVNKPGSFSFHKENKVDEAFLYEGTNEEMNQTNKKKKIKAVDSRGSLSTKELMISSRSDTEDSVSSASWRKLLPCCSSPRMRKL